MKLTYFALAISSALVITGCGGSAGNDDNVPPEPISHEDPSIDASAIAFNDISVHDPSVIRADDGTWYVVGSHLAMAKSSDLMSWEYVANPFDPVTPEDGDNTIHNNPLFNTYATENAEGIEWVNGNLGSWASDIIELADGRFYFYYNHCSTGTDPCNAPRSYMGVAVSDSIEGPFVDQGVFLYSGQSAEEVDAGFGIGDMTAHDANIHPNVIDPDVFHDKDGKLWMVYGSYSGGIFILEMDETSGKPLPDQGYGKHIAGGAHSLIEGAYMLYSPESDYYYLFTSFGGFGSTQGYNIRVSRSRNPNGPFLDARGQDMVNAKGDANAISAFGVKLMGGFEFTSEIGDNSASRGYLSPGHNSAYFDAQTGQHFLIAHTRFPNRETPEYHSVRVHEMFINNDGWLVASPQRYAPISGENIVDAGDIVGRYKIINHGSEINLSAIQSQYLSLNADRTITGEYSGYYRLNDDEPNTIDLHINGRGKWVGELRWQWDATRESLAPVFTALSAQGEALWGTQMETVSNASALQAIVDAVDIPTTFADTSIELPESATRGGKITWTSSNEDLLTSDGRVWRPTANEGDQTVTLTATVTLDGQQISQNYDLVILANAPFDQLGASFDFEGNLSESLGLFADATPTGDRIFKEGEAEIAYADASDRPDGEGLQALSLDGSNGVLLPNSLISSYEYTVSFWAKPTAITQYTAIFFGLTNEFPTDNGNFDSLNWLSFVARGGDENTMLWSFNVPVWFDGSAGERIPEAQWSHTAFSVDNGLARVIINGEEKFVGGNIADFFSDNEGKFALGVNYFNDAFNGLIDDLNIYTSALNAAEVAALELNDTPPSQFLEIAANVVDLGDISAVKEDLSLPKTGSFDTRITWTSSNPEIIAIDGDKGVVTRPGRNSSDANLSLSATITLSGQSITRTFDVTVSKASAPTPLASYSFESDLSDRQENFADGLATGNLLNNSGGSSVFGEGIIGQALNLDGSYGVKLANNHITDATYAISLWLKPAALQNYTTALFGGTTASWISVLPGGTNDAMQAMLWADAGGQNFFDVPTDTTLEIGQWSHFAAVNNNGDVSVYINGEERFSATGFPSIFSASGNYEFGIGVNYWDTPFNGLVDELKFFDEALGADDVAGLYSEGTAQ